MYIYIYTLKKSDYIDEKNNIYMFDKKIYFKKLLI